MSFRETLTYLINRYNIDVSEIPDRPTLDLNEVKCSEKNIALESLHSHILELKRKIPLEKYQPLCAAYFMIKDSTESDVLTNSKKIEDKILWLKSTL